MGGEMGGCFPHPFWRSFAKIQASNTALFLAWKGHQSIKYIVMQGGGWDIWVREIPSRKNGYFGCGTSMPCGQRFTERRKACPSGPTSLFTPLVWCSTETWAPCLDVERWMRALVSKTIVTLAATSIWLQLRLSASLNCSCKTGMGAKHKSCLWKCC